MQYHPIVENMCIVCEKYSTSGELAIDSRQKMLVPSEWGENFVTAD